MEINSISILFIILSFLTGAVLTFLLIRSANVPRSEYESVKEKFHAGLSELNALRAMDAELRKQLESFNSRLTIESNNLRRAENDLAAINAGFASVQKLLEEEKLLNYNLQDEIRDQKETLSKNYGHISKMEAQYEALLEKLETQKHDIEEIRQKSLLEFESVANKLLEEKTARFTLSNKESMDLILNPLKENLTDFKKRVEETYDKESKERFSLEARIKELVSLNQQISKDATNLTNALKGQAKTQGNWGEMILESILEQSGLVKNREYFLQQSFVDEDGNRKQPDVIIKYPDDRQIIIDSKVSLVAYERFANEEDPDTQRLYLNAHMASLRKHIDDLSSKEYHKMKSSLDFVMLFVPIEPAFMTAMHFDREIWNYAYKKRIILISPTNLIAALKMISDIWKREYQNANAARIAEHGQRLYEKFVNFISDLEDIGSSLNKASEKYNQALGKLSAGKGNLISQAEKLKKLGISTKKGLPEKFLFENEENEGEVS